MTQRDLARRRTSDFNVQWGGDCAAVGGWCKRLPQRVQDSACDLTSHQEDSQQSVWVDYRRTRPIDAGALQSRVSRAKRQLTANGRLKDTSIETGFPLKIPPCIVICFNCPQEALTRHVPHHMWFNVTPEDIIHMDDLSVSTPRKKCLDYWALLFCLISNPQDKSLTFISALMDNSLRVSQGSKAF